MGNKIFYGVIVLIFVIFGVVFFMVGNSKEESINQALENSPYTDVEDEELSGATINSMSDDNYKYNVTYNERTEAIESGEEIYVYYWSPTCQYCMAETPKIVGEYEENFSDKNFMQINVDVYSGAYEDADLGLQGTPTLIKYKDGEKVVELIGAQKSEEVYTAYFNGELDGFIQSEQTEGEGDTTDEDGNTETTEEVEEVEEDTKEETKDTKDKK